MKGKMRDDVRLQEGDVIIVNPYQSLVQILGKVKRPMKGKPVMLLTQADLDEGDDLTLDQAAQRVGRG